MTKTTYASGRQTLPFTLSNIFTTNTGSLGITGNIFLSIQGQNRVGLNLNSALVSVSVSSNTRISIDLSTLILSGEDWQNIIISASTTNDVTTLTQIVSVRVSDLSVPVVLTSAEIFKLTTTERTVTNPAVLPSLTANEQGLIRFVSSLGYYYYYDRYSSSTVDNTLVLSASVGRWLRIGSINTYISDTTDSDGCDQDVRTPNLTVNIPTYSLDGSKGSGVQYWIRNDTNGLISSGTRITGIVSLANEDVSQLFNNLIILEILGYINLTTGVIDTGIASGEILYSPDTTPLVLPEDLPSNHAVVIKASPKFKPEYLNDQIVYKSVLSIYLYFDANRGSYAAGSQALGNVIYDAYSKLIILPDVGNSVVKKQGSGLILGYELLSLPEETISLSSNTNNQYIYLTSSGYGFSSVTNGIIGTVKRALVGTSNGIANSYNYGTVSLNSSKQLIVNITYPTIIRTDYPDTKIAGYSSNKFNANTIIIYIKNSSNAYFKSEQTRTPNSSNDIFTLSNSDFTSVSGLPSNNNDFGLYKANSVNITTNNNNSDFISDTYTVYIAFKYNEVVTSIDHSVSELIELPANLGTLLSTISTKWFTGSGVPNSNLGINNDLYLNTANSDIYKKINDTWTVISNIKGNDGTISNSFTNIAVSGQSTVVADSSTDTLTLIAGSNITLTTNASNDSITIASSGGGGGGSGITKTIISDGSSPYNVGTSDEFIITTVPCTINLPENPSPLQIVEIITDWTLSLGESCYTTNILSGSKYIIFNGTTSVTNLTINTCTNQRGGKLMFGNYGMWAVVPPSTESGFGYV